VTTASPLVGQAEVRRSSLAVAGSSRPVTIVSTAPVVLTCLAASASYGGAVTLRALLGYVLPAVLINAAVSTALVRRGLLRSAVTVGVGVALIWAEVANVASGIGNGPAAKSSFAVGALTVVAVVASTSRWPATFLAPVVGIVVVALLLGAGSEVPIVAVATAVCVVVILAIVESSARRRPTTPSEARPWSVLVFALLVAAVAATTAATQERVDHRPVHAPLAGATNAQVVPPWHDPLVRSHHSTGASAVTAPSPSGAVDRRHHRRHHGVTAAGSSSRSVGWLVALGIAVLLLMLLLVVVARLAWVQLAWRRTAARLREQPGRQAIVGAWQWVGLRLALYRYPLPPRLSPDRAATDPFLDGMPARVAAGLRGIGALATPAAFAPPVRGSDADTDVGQSWVLARTVDRQISCALSRSSRFRSRLVMPPSTAAANASG